MKNLTPISIKIKDFLLSQGIKEEEILDVLGNIYRNIYDNYSVDVEIEDVYFNLVRDTVWYNLERSDGEYTLASYGKHFPVFMNMCEDGNEVSELSELYRELKKINEYFNTRKIYICTISGGDIHFNKDSKKKIAKLAAQFISDGDYIYLDAGTTTYEIIDYIKGKDIKVVTNGIIHLEKLIANDIETYLIGGRIKKSTLAIVGVKALRDLSEFRFDKAFIGINGINENGYSTHDIEEALIKKQAIDNSNKAFILADSSKFDIVYFANVAKLEEATIITDKKEVNKNIIKHTKIINTY